MEKSFKAQRLLSHAVQPESITNIVAATIARIKATGDKEHVTVQRQLELLDELCQFDFGRFLLQNQGLNGYWTHYMLTYPWFGKKTGLNNRGEPLSTLERFLLERSPVIVATQQRFELFLQQNQQAVKNHAKLACIPSGMMGELLYLDYKNITDIELIGIDYDLNTFEDARKLAEQQHLLQFMQLRQGDAWELGTKEEWDLISSNGLNIYEADDNKVTELYRQFYLALKPGGKLVASYVTPPPGIVTSCEWNLEIINKEDLLLQRILFGDIINAKFQCFRSTETTQQQITAAGFSKIEFIYDKAKIFPTIVAIK